MASSVAQPQAPREHLNELIAELYGDPPTPAHLSTAGPRWQQAVAQVEEQLRTKLHVEVLPERMRKALELVRADAVTLHADGSASVQSGKQTYMLAPNCPCAGTKHIQPKTSVKDSLAASCRDPDASGSGRSGIAQTG